jgi:hypothetical protein
MPRPTQEKLRGLCLVLLAAGAFACGEDDPPPVPEQALPIWGACETWRRRDGSCDQAALLADYQDCLRTEGIPHRQRLVEHQARRNAVSRNWQRATIVCVEKRGWKMTEAGFRNLPGRPTPPPPPPPS